MPLRIGVAGLGYWGPNLARNFAALPGCELALVLRRLARRRASAGRRAFPGARFTGDLDELLADPDARRGRARHAGPDARRARRAGARGRQALLRREAAGAVGRRRRARRRRRGASRAHADGRPPARVPPGRREAQGDRRLRRARRHPLHLLEPPQPRQAARRRERAVVARRPRRLGGAAPGRRGAVRGRARAASPTCARASRTSSSASCASRPACAAHLHLSWLDPHKERRFTVVGSQADGDLRRHGRSSASSPSTTRASTRTSRLLRRVHHPLGRHLEPARSRTREPLRLECEHFVECIRDGRAAALGRRQRACASCACSRRCSSRSTRRGGSSVQPSDRGAAACVARRGRAARRRRRASAPTSSIHAGTVVGDGCVIQDGAVLGKPPKLAPPLDAPRGAAAAARARRRRGRLRAARSCSPARAIGAGRDRRRPGLRARARA